MTARLLCRHLVWLGMASLLLPHFACKRETPPTTSAPPPPPAQPVASPLPAPPSSPVPARAAQATPRIISTHKGTATWYDPPDTSPPVKRAPGEMTAAYDRLPLHSMVRVVNLENDRSIVVRITDGGVPKATGIDLCKEAAEEIGLVGKGKTKVRIEHLEPVSPDGKSATPDPK